MSDPTIVTIACVKDEELHIERCVESVRSLGPVFVVDGGSTDATVPLAERAGADVVQREWRGYSEQKNWALGQAGDRGDWVLFLDADEYLAPEAREELLRTVREGAADGFYLPRRFVFLGRPLLHAHWYPDFQLRLFRAGRGRFEDRRVHEHMIIDGRVAESSIELMHENLKGVADYVSRLNRYAVLEAREAIDPSAAPKKGSLRGSWAERRRALKQIWLRLPARWATRFVWNYVVRRGFLDGRPGFVFCALNAVHDFLTEANVHEHRLGYAPEQVRARVVQASRATSA